VLHRPVELAPFFVHFAKFGSSVGGIVSELPTIRKLVDQDEPSASEMPVLAN
jgi:hypothetical protein